MAINRASIAKELLPGLNAVFGIEYGQVDDEHKSLYEVENSDRAFVTTGRPSHSARFDPNAL